MVTRCLECGYEYGRGGAVEEVASFPARYRAAVAGVADERMRTRPGPWTWSALEYLCHVRDVLLVHRERVARVRTEDGPVLPSMRRDERAVEERYNEQAVADVLDELGHAAEALAADLTAVADAEWDRTGEHPTTGEQPLWWMAANVVHEGRHHLLDVERVLAVV